MNRTFQIAVSTLGFALVSTSANAFNLLVNPGFETGNISPWFNDREFGTNGIGQLWHAVNSDSHSGSWSAMVESNKEMRQNFSAPVPTSLVTQASVWVKVPEVGGIFGIWHYYSDASIGFEIFSPVDTGWNFYNITAQLVPSKTLIGFGVNGYSGGPGGPDIVFADDAVVDGPVPEPATILALGFGALVLLRRRQRN